MYGTTAGGTPVGHEAFRDISSGTTFPLRFIVPAEKIVALNGRTATFGYSVDTFDLIEGRRVRRTLRPSALYPSPERSYRITGSAQGLPPPVVPKAEDGWLDPDRIDEREGVQVDIVSGLSEGDRVTLSWRGTKMTTPFTDSLTAHGATATFFVPKSPYLTDNDGADVIVDYHVAFAAGGSAPSEPRLLHVGALGALAITSVRDAKGEVPNGGSTDDTALTISGTAAADQSVELFDGSTSKGTATVDGNGAWTMPLSGLALGNHSFKARGKYGSEPESSIRTLTVLQRLAIDTSPLILSGALIRFGAVPTTPPTGTTAVRAANGGTPPYGYSTSTNAVNIDANTGRVVSYRNGQATITARDAGGQTASYIVHVSNVTEIDGWNGYNTYQMCAQNATNFGGRIPTLAEWQALRAAYGNSPQIPPEGGDANGEAWSSTSAGGKLLHTIVPNSGAQGNQPDQSFIIGGRGGARGWSTIVRNATPI